MPGHTPRERAKHGSHRGLPEAAPRRAAAPVLPAQAASQAIDVQAALGPGFNQTPIIGRSLFGSGKFSKSEMMKGFRVLDRPKLGRGQKKVTFPGVSRMK